MGKNKGRKKTPVAASVPQAGKHPRLDASAMADWDNMPITWHFRHMEHDGPFGWHICTRDVLIDSILDRAGSFETMTWRELREKDLLHTHPIANVGDEARQRLEQLKYPDVDELYSLHIAKKPRVWGIRDRLYFRVLWWDPKHEVYPMNPADN